MGTLFSDNYNRANGGVGSNYTFDTDNTSSAAIASNQLAITYSGGNRNLLYTTTSAHAAVADCKVSAKRITGTGYDGGPLARKQSGADTYYYLDVYGTTNVDIYRRVAGTDTLVGSRNTANAANDIYRLEVQGSGATVTLRAFVNGVQSGTDLADTNASRITGAGQAGVYVWATDTFDDFLVEDFSVPSFRSRPQRNHLLRR